MTGMNQLNCTAMAPISWNEVICRHTFSTAYGTRRARVRTHEVEEELVEFWCVEPIVRDAESVLCDQVVREGAVDREHVNRLPQLFAFIESFEELVQIILHDGL